MKTVQHRSNDLKRRIQHEPQTFHSSRRCHNSDLYYSFFIAAHAQNQGSAAKNATGKRHKIVIQVSDNDPAKWNLALNNAKNLQDDVGAANVDIEIVAYGPGINMLKLESTTGARIADAMKANVKVIACENTMRGQKLTLGDMLPALSYVPAGVTEIMAKQGEGWAYLRA